MALASHLTQMVQALSALIAQHLKLARAELRDDAKQLGTQVATVAAFVPLVLLGYALLNVALALWLRRYLAAEASFAAVGGANLVVGALGIFSALRKLSRARPLEVTRTQLEASVEVVLAAGGAPQLSERGAP